MSLDDDAVAPVDLEVDDEVTVTPVDLQVERVVDGVLLTFELDGVSGDFSLQLTPRFARDLGSRLFAAGDS